MARELLRANELLDDSSRRSEGTRTRILLCAAFGFTGCTDDTVTTTTATDLRLLDLGRDVGITYGLFDPPDPNQPQ